MASRRYGHFCMLAKALERVGDRWTMLVVRDLASRPRRFTDLMDRLGGITPRTLTQRLRDLEKGGLVDVDREPGRREVWYRLTPAGQDLLPALDELMVWALRHIAEPPRPGELAHPEHLLWALQVQLEREEVQAGPLRWLVRLVDDGSYVIRSDGHNWTFQPGEVDEPDVLVTATKHAFAKFLAGFPSMRSPEAPDIQITGTKRAIRVFLRAIEVFPFGRQAPRDVLASALPRA
jgi:DNA-binding HxlR family transcriptional regulator